MWRALYAVPSTIGQLQDSTEHEGKHTLKSIDGLMDSASRPFYLAMIKRTWGEPIIRFWANTYRAIHITTASLTCISNCLAMLQYISAFIANIVGKIHRSGELGSYASSICFVTASFTANGRLLKMLIEIGSRGFASDNAIREAS